MVAARFRFRANFKNRFCASTTLRTLDPRQILLSVLDSLILCNKSKI